MRALAPNQFGKVCPHCPEKGVQAREAFGPSDDPSLLRKALTYLTKIRVVSISREKK